MKNITWFTTSPDPNTPECICSVCALVINEDMPPITVTNEKEKTEARFHIDCFKELLKDNQITLVG